MRIESWFRPRRMLILFLVTMGIFVSGAVWLGWSFLRQDRALDEQRIRERLDSTADVVATELRAQFLGLGQTLETLRSLPAGDLPTAAAAALEDLAPGAVIVRVDEAGVATYPAGSTLYYPALPNRHEPAPETFAAAERLEYGGRRAQAADRYRRLANTSDPGVRAGALLRLARVYRQIGRARDAASIYDELADLGDTPVGGLPAAMLALWARCDLLDAEHRLTDLRQQAQRLDDALLSGAWTIDRPTFLLYREDAEAFLARVAGEDDSDRPRTSTPEADAASNRAVVAAGLDVLWREWGRGGSSGATALASPPTIEHGYPETTAGRLRSPTGVTAAPVVIWRGTIESAVGLVATPAFLQAQFVEPIESILVRQSAVLHLSATPDGGVDALHVRRTRSETGLPWELQLVSADPAGDQARQAGRRRLLLTGLALVVVLVAAGTYFSSRAVARELEVARMQADLVSAVSHDFRTPLTSLRQVTEALIGNRVTDNRRHAYYRIQRRGIDRLHRLVEGWLDFRRMEAGAREFQREPFAVRQWLEGLVRDFRADVEKQGYAVDLTCAVDGEAVGDEPALTRALWNVLDNAVKYSPECKTVWVECRRDADDGALVITVRDRGLGIDPAERDAIFDRFVRGTAAARTRSSGTGLGLAMVKHVIDAHGGEIEIRGDAGNGTTVTVRLPGGQTR